MLILSRAEVEALLIPAAVLDAVSAGLQALSAGAFAAAPRQSVPADGGAFLTMADGSWTARSSSSSSACSPATSRWGSSRTPR